MQPFVGPESLASVVLSLSSKIDGVPRLVQTLCLMNYISIMFATFWCARGSLRGGLKGEGRDRFTDGERLDFDQQYAIVSYFLKDVSLDKKWPKSEQVLACARHMMRVFHGGAVIQAIVLLGRSNENRTKHNHSYEQDRERRYNAGDMEVLLSSRSILELRRKTLDYFAKESWEERTSVWDELPTEVSRERSSSDNGLTDQESESENSDHR